MPIIPQFPFGRIVPPNLRSFSIKHHLLLCMLLKFRLRFGTASKHLSQFLALSSIQQYRPFVRQPVTEQILVNLIELEFDFYNYFTNSQII